MPTLDRVVDIGVLEPNISLADRITSWNRWGGDHDHDGLEI